VSFTRRFHYGGVSPARKPAPCRPDVPSAQGGYLGPLFRNWSYTTSSSWHLSTPEFRGSMRGVSTRPSYQGPPTREAPRFGASPLLPTSACVAPKLRASVWSAVHHPLVPRCAPVATRASATASRPNQSIATDRARSPGAVVGPTLRRNHALRDAGSSRSRVPRRIAGDLHCTR